MQAYQVDIHDDFWMHLPKENIEAAKEIYADALIEVNRWLGGTIPMAAMPSFGNNIKEIK